MRFAILLGVVATAQAAGDPPEFKTTLKNKADAVVATTSEGTTYLTVTSPGGIGSATIARKADTWPKAVVVRLKLRGLEGFSASAGKTSLHAFVNTSAMKSVTFEKDGKKVEGYDAKHPLWTEIRIDKENGVFEIALRKAFFDGNPETLTLHWTDFYRR